MDVVIAIPAALVASPRPCAAPVVGVRLRADDAQLRLLDRSSMPIARSTWRRTTGSDERGIETAGKQVPGGRSATAGTTYVSTNQHFAIRSGPPTSRPPA